jgi:hypothetical protein
MEEAERIARFEVLRFTIWDMIFLCTLFPTHSRLNLKLLIQTCSTALQSWQSLVVWVPDITTVALGTSWMVPI